MTIQYLISSCFMLAILIIFVKKGGSDIRQPRSRRIYLWLLAFIIAYVIIDAFFSVVLYISEQCHRLSHHYLCLLYHLCIDAVCLAYFCT